MNGGHSIRRIGLVCVLALAALILPVHSALAAGIRVAPSVERVLPGEDFYVDIVAEGIPVDDGLGTVQFRLNVEAPGAKVAGVPDLAQASADSVAVATPLLISEPTATRSGLGPFFQSLHQGNGGILVLDNEPLAGGSALFTYAHTHGANRPSGTGAVARFRVRVGSAVAAERIDFTLTDVLLLDGGPAYPLDSNVGATVTLRCTSIVPDLAGKTLSEAQAALAVAGLTAGGTYEIANPNGTRPLGVVLEQSAPAGSELDCEAAVDVATNAAPAELTSLSAADVSGDDTGKVALSWIPSASPDTAGYRVYEGSALLAEVSGGEAAGAEISGMDNGVEKSLRIAAFDSFGNESAGVSVMAKALDDVPPLVTVSGVQEGTYYNVSVTPQLEIVETNSGSQTITLNGAPYDLTPIALDGAYVLAVSATDASGNTTIRSVAFTIDATAPAITVGNLADGGYYGFDLTPEIVIDEVNPEEDATTYLLDGITYQPGALIETEGSHTLAISARDKAGNSSSLSIHFVIDKTAPVVSIEGVADGAHYNVDLVPTASVADTWLKNSSITLNGQPFVSGTTLTAEGEYILVATGEDHAGNSAAQSVGFVVDKTAPILVVEGVTSGSHYNLDLAPVASVTDAWLKNSTVTLNGEAFVSGSAVTEEGEYLLALAGEDEAGNKAELAVDFVVDKTPPQIVLSGVADGALYNIDVTPVVNITDLYLDGSTLTLDGQPFTSGTLVSEEGAYVMAAGAEDRAGNRTDITLDFVIDKTAPTSTSSVGAPSYGAGDQLFVAADTTIALTSVDGGVVPTGVERLTFALDQTQQWLDYAGSFTIADLAEGGHDIHFRASDKAGNVEETRTLPVILDKSAPATAVSQAGAQFTDTAGTFYITGATAFTLSASDNLSGVARTAYRVDGGTWIDHAPFTLNGLTEGSHDIGYRSIDNVRNTETEQVLTVTVDNTAAVTEIGIRGPQHQDGSLYVTDATVFNLHATDNLSGIARTEYRIDGGAWTSYAPFTLAGLPDGAHTIEFHSVDHVENAEDAKKLEVLLDNTPPETSISFNRQSYIEGEILLVSRQTEITLSAADNLSGVAVTQYRYDDAPGWSTCYGTFRLADLAYGTHILRYRSIDNVENSEEEKTVTVTLTGVEVETEVLNLPRVLIWTEDPTTLAGKQRPAYTLEEVRDLVGEALGVSDIYATMTADKNEFRELLRSGIYNMTMILNQDVSFDAVFLREMREAVNRGTGLLVSSWGSSVPPLWQEVFGVDFKGSASMDENERPLHLFESPVSADQSLTASGRVLRTALDGGVLAGILPAESTCEGLRGLTLRYPLGMAVGDRVIVSLTVPQGKKTVTVDEEELTVTALPEAGINHFTGNTAGDLAIGGITEDGITLTLAAPYGYLEESYILSLTIERADETTVTSGPVAVTPVCKANLQAGISLRSFEVLSADEERVKNGDDLPAVVLGEYGLGRTAFLSYSLIESALNGQRSEHLALLRKAASWLLPETAQPEAGGVALLETRIKLLGADLDLQANDTLGEGLTHLPLFDLTQNPLAYTFYLQDGEQAAYRYFLRIADRQGDNDKTTTVLLGLEEGYFPFADYPAGFSVGEDSRTLLLQALAWVDGQLPAHPEAGDALQAIRDELVRIASLPRTTSAESETVIHETVQTVHQALQLGFDSTGLRALLDQYLRILGGEGYFN